MITDFYAFSLKMFFKKKEKKKTTKKNVRAGERGMILKEKQTFVKKKKCFKESES